MTPSPSNQRKAFEYVPSSRVSAYAPGSDRSNGSRTFPSGGGISGQQHNDAYRDQTFHSTELTGRPLSLPISPLRLPRPFLPLDEDELMNVGGAGKMSNGIMTRLSLDYESY